MFNYSFNDMMNYAFKRPLLLWDAGDGCSCWITAGRSIYCIYSPVLSQRCAVLCWLLQARPEQYSGGYFSCGLMEVSTAAHRPDFFITIQLSVSVQRGRKNSDQFLIWGHSIYNRGERATSLSTLKSVYQCDSPARIWGKRLWEEEDEIYYEKWKPSLESDSPESDWKYKSGQN